MTQKVTIEISEKEAAFLKQYACVYEEEREFDITPNPIVIVQKRRKRMTAPGYESNYKYYHGESSDACGFGDFAEMIDDFILTNELEFSESERLEFMAKLHCKFFFYPNERVECRGYDFWCFTTEYDWEDVAYFLTREEADRYREYQAHNLGVSRTFSMGTGYNNCGDLVESMPLLRRIGRNLYEGK